MLVCLTGNEKNIRTAQGAFGEISQLRPRRSSGYKPLDASGESLVQSHVGLLKSFG